MVRKCKFIMVALMIISIGLLSACSSKQEIILGSNLVKYNVNGTNEFGFNMNFLLTDKNSDVEFVKFDGKNTQGISVKLADDTYDEIKNLKIDSYYLKILGFVCQTADDNVEIDSVTLKVNGNEVTAKFDTPIIHNVVSTDDSNEIQITNYPMFIATNSYSTTEYSFSYSTEENIIIDDFKFNDFLDMSDSEIIVDGVSKGKLSNALPINVSKNSEISIKGKIKFSTNDKLSEYDSIYCNSQLVYTLQGKTEQKIYTSSIVSQSVSNENDAEEVIKLLVA